MLLLTIIYIAFIGLGLPDSLLGTAWPAIYQNLKLPFSYGSFVTAIIYFGTMISSMNSARFIKKLGTFKVTLTSTLLTVIALIGFSFSGSFGMICLCAVPLGLGAGCIDTALNNYVSLHYSSKHMNFLHCFYGIGVVASPYIISSILQASGSWREGYRVVTVVQTVIALIILISGRVWEKAESVDGQSIGETNIQVLSFKQILKTPGVPAVMILILGDGIIESLLNAMGTTYLVEQKGFFAETAAGMILFYYLGMTLGRFTAGILSEKLSMHGIIKLSYGILEIGILLMLLMESRGGLSVALVLLGFGVGPLFPNITYLTPVLFGSEKSSSIMGAQMSMGSIALMLSPIICSFFSQIVGLMILPIILFISLIIMMIAYGYIRKIIC